MSLINSQGKPKRENRLSDKYLWPEGQTLVWKPLVALRTRQVLPYLVALVSLAWILGSLARSGTGGPGLWANNYWIVWLVYLLPIFGLVAIVVMGVFLVINWKLLSDVLGHGMAARRRQNRKQHSTITLLVWMGFWFIAIGVLYWRCGAIICRPDSQTGSLPQTVTDLVGGNPATLSLPSLLIGPVYALADILASPAFSIAFLGLLVVSSVIIVRSFKVSLDETKNVRFLPIEVREEGSTAVQDALRVLETQRETDPKTRIIICYERMIKAAATVGADVSVSQTARELEKGIRSMFRLKGRAIQELTQLFEEARFSLHPMTETDGEQAQVYLREIGEELRTAVTVGY